MTDGFESREMTVEDWLGADNQLGIDIWERKYRNNGESFVEWLDRVSGADPEVRKLIVEKKFLFGGRILAGRGANPRDRKVSLSNCYCVAPPEDNLESIFECAKKLARTYSYGGGCGTDLSGLAPRGSKVRNAARESSGAVSFMDLYSMVTGLISQNGRRGALMLSLSSEHPDIEEFIDIKKDLERVTKANISVRISDDFMSHATSCDDHTLEFTREETGERITKKINARALLHKLAENNWDMGEPGMLFWDTICNWNLLSGYDNFRYAGVNPCAEEPLPAGGSCLLGSINLAEFVDSAGNFNFDDFSDAIFTATVALNNVLDEGLPLHPLQEQRDSVSNWRQIGLGVMGVADMLIKMGVTYGSDESLELCKSISNCLLNSAVYTSANLAAKHGPFPRFDIASTERSEFYQHNISERNKQFIRTNGLRNSQLLTIAPTGTLSTMIGVSGGMEPIFANYYTRRTQSLHGKDVTYKVYTPIVKRYMQAHAIQDDADLPEYFVTAADISPINRVMMQAAWQTNIDASISSTVNLPNSATVEDVEDIYIDAWLNGLKGITVFREGCRRAAILSTSTSSKSDETSDTDDASDSEPACKDPILPRGFIIDTSDNLVGKKRKLVTGCGSLHCTAFFDPITGDLMETYLSKGSTGGCNNFMIGLSRMISLAARAGVGIDAIIDQLNSSGACPSYAVRAATKHDTSKGSCCPVAIGNALKNMWIEMQAEIDGEDEGGDQAVEINGACRDEAVKIVLPRPNIQPASGTTRNATCPECGGQLVFQGGCQTCPDCGWSKCA